MLAVGALASGLASAEPSLDPALPPAPTAEFSALPTTGSAPHSVEFTDLSQGQVDAWSWNFGDGSSSSLQHPVHVYTAAGTYSVSLTVVGPGGSSTELETGLVTVEEHPPIADFKAFPRYGDSPLVVEFTDETQGDVDAWLWDFGDGTTSRLPSPTHVYAAPGTYTVRLGVNGPSGYHVETKVDAIEVSSATGEPPVALFSASPVSGAAPLSVSFTNASTGATSYLWSFGDGTTSSAGNPSHTYSAPGTYSVSLAASGPGGSDVEVRTDLVQVHAESLDASFTAAPVSGPAPLAVTFTDTSSGAVTSWLWDFGDGAQSAQRNPTHVYSSTGTFDVRLLVRDAFGTNLETRLGLVQTGSSSACNAGNARDNNPNVLKLGYDFIPFDTNDTRGCWVVYSAKQKPDFTPGIGNTAGIFVFELVGGEVLIFGSGYGDPWGGPNSALFDAKKDVDQVNAIVEGCMGLPRVGTRVHFVVPHGHGDHVNASFIRELDEAGYDLLDIVFHNSDASYVNGMQNWRSEDRARFVKIYGGFECHSEILSYPGVAGRIWFCLRPGHTPGSIDLVVDVAGNPNDRKVILGSAVGGSCPINVPGSDLVIKAHGTAYVP